MNRGSRIVRVVVEVAALAVNAAIILSFYVAEQMAAHSGVAKNNFGVFSERAFWIGVVALIIAVLSRAKLKGFVVRSLTIGIITLWNQTCLVAFLVSLIPFRLA